MFLCPQGWLLIWKLSVGRWRRCTPRWWQCNLTLWHLFPVCRNLIYFALPALPDVNFQHIPFIFVGVLTPGLRQDKESLIKLFVTATQKDMAFNSSMMRCRCHAQNIFGLNFHVLHCRLQTVNMSSRQELQSSEAKGFGQGQGQSEGPREAATRACC